MGQPKQSAFWPGSLDRVVNDNPLPSVAPANHEITFLRARQQEPLPVGHGHWKYAAGRHNESHFVTDRDPILRIKICGPIGTRCTDRKVYSEYRSKNQKSRSNCFHGFKLQSVIDQRVEEPAVSPDYLF